MVISLSDAYGWLQLPIGSDRDSIRTQYKRLASKYHSKEPEDFMKVSNAFRRLETDNENTDLSEAEAAEQYKTVFQNHYKSSYYNGYNPSSDSDSDSDDNRSGIRGTNGSGTALTNEERERNASALISDEEREKKKKEKRKEKKKVQKKRRKEKKKQENNLPVGMAKPSTNGKSKKNNSNNKNGGGDQANPSAKKSVNDEAEGFDDSCAFVKHAKGKKKQPGPGGDRSDLAANKVAGYTPEVMGEEAAQNQPEENVEDLDDATLRSRQLAVRGNEMANSGHYAAAIDLFTEAVRLVPEDYRFLGNRSYCYDRLEQYEKAFKDGEKSLRLKPDWPKGYFRKGRALAGLKSLNDAEEAFLQVLKLDPACDDAKVELLNVRSLQLSEMGFSKDQADQALQKYGSVQPALDALLSGEFSNVSIEEDLYVSDEDDYCPGNIAPVAAPVVPRPAPVVHTVPTPLYQPPVFQQPSPPIAAAAASVPFTPASSHKTADIKMNPSNPEGLSALWVGNVLPEVSQARLQTLFAKYANVTSIRMLPEKYCAFVNLKTKEDAGRAMKHLQSYDIAGQQLLIKFPDNPQTAGNVVIRKPTTQAAAAASSSTVLTKSTKTHRGPVNGDECYFWRTTGCTYEHQCKHKHIKKNKGIDLKAWHK